MSSTHLTAPETSPAVPCNILIDAVPCGTLVNVRQTLGMLASLPSGLSEQDSMGMFHVLTTCIDALSFEIDRATKSNTDEDGHDQAGADE